MRALSAATRLVSLAVGFGVDFGSKKFSHVAAAKFIIVHGMARERWVGELHRVAVHRVAEKRVLVQPVG